MISFYDLCIYDHLQKRNWPLLATGALVKIGKDKNDEDYIFDFCTATMLSDRKTAITAAHCFLGYKVDYDEHANDNEKYTLKIKLTTDDTDEYITNQIRFCPMYSKDYNVRKWSTVRGKPTIADFQWCEVVQY